MFLPDKIWVQKASDVENIFLLVSRRLLAGHAHQTEAYYSNAEPQLLWAVPFNRNDLSEDHMNRAGLTCDLPAF